MLRREFLSASSIAVGVSAVGLGSAAPLRAAKSILDYGAVPGGKTLNTQSGIFLSGGLELKSRVTLYLEAGCVLLGSPNIADYAYHPGPGKLGDANGHHLIFAQDADDVTLCGPGTLDGQGEAYWEPNPNVLSARPEEALQDVAQDTSGPSITIAARRPWWSLLSAVTCASAA